MKKIIFIVSFFAVISMPVTGQDQPLKIMMIGAHPDDCDIKSGGLAALYASLGHQVKFLSVTNGDAGHMDQGGGILAKRRYEETQKSGQILGIQYDVLDNHDGELLPTLAIRLAVIRKIREWDADVVISHRSNDYHPDHRYTGILVQDAAFMVGVPNIAADTPALRKNPVFLYYQDNFQKPNPFEPTIVVDITSVIDQKVNALDAHVSQFYEWLPWIANDPDIVPEEAGERKIWLKQKRTSPPNPSVLIALEKWYGKDNASKIKFAEAFELCEYGSQPSIAEIKRLFPMIPKEALRP